MHIFSDFKIAVRIEKCFFGIFAFAVFIIAAVIPHRIAAISIRADVIRNISYNQLRLWNVVFAVILKIIVEYFTFNHQYTALK